MSLLLLRRLFLFSRKKIDYSKCLRLTALENNVTFTITSKSATPNISTLYYSIDGGETWTTVTPSTTAVITTPINTNLYILLKGTYTEWDLSAYTASANKYINIAGSGRHDVSGNIMSLIFNDKFEGKTSLKGFRHAFKNLFLNNTKLVNANLLILPATKLSPSCYSYMFSGCSSLVSTPSLHATKLESYCYLSMFSLCTSLVAAPTLPATTLAPSCYSAMFNGCSNLTTHSALPATELYPSCYYSMYYGTGITTTPQLPATVMRTACYGNMFGYTNIVNPPALPATQLANACYLSMFTNCLKLTSTPVLPATVLAENCYSSMFLWCVKLTTAPVLPATTLVAKCYEYMFYGCTSMNYIKALFGTTPSDSYTKDWVNKVKSSGTFVKASAATWSVVGNNGVPTGWSVSTQQTDLSDKYLTFEAIDTATFSFSNSLQYSLDGTNWVSLAANTNTPSISSGDKIYFKGSLVPTSDAGCGTFSSTGNFKAYGHPLSLILNDGAYGQILSNSYAFAKLFKENTYLVDAKDLLLYTATNYCCDSMFEGCTSLLYGPNLLAEISGLTYSYRSIFKNCTSLLEVPLIYTYLLGGYQYLYAFMGCTSLTSVPPILILLCNGMYNCAYMFLNCTSLTTVKDIYISGTGAAYLFHYAFDGCSALSTTPNILMTSVSSLNANLFSCMFRNCTSLVSIQDFPEPTSASTNLFFGMFLGCTSLLDPPELSATTLGASSYSSMFSGCTSLRRAPKLPAMNLGNGCYSAMFKNCTSLTIPPELPATTVTLNCYLYMFLNCTSLTRTPRTLAATTVAASCYSYMFTGCSAITNAVLILPAKSLASTCYEYMFDGCSSLQNAPELPATTLLSYSYRYMFRNCSSLTEAPYLPATTLYSYAYYNMFNGCTSLTKVQDILPALTLTNYCYNGMFKGCTSLTKAPDLPALSSASYCYNGMFDGCTKLNFVRAMMTFTPASAPTGNWLRSVASSGTFVKNSAATWNVTGNNGIPSSWNVQTVPTVCMINTAYDGTTITDTGIKLFDGTYQNWTLSIIFSVNSWSSQETIFDAKDENSPYKGMVLRLYDNSNPNLVELGIGPNTTRIMNKGFTLSESSDGQYIRYENDGVTPLIIKKVGTKISVHYGDSFCDLLENEAGDWTHNKNLYIGGNYDNVENQNRRFMNGTITHFNVLIQ